MTRHILKIKNESINRTPENNEIPKFKKGTSLLSDSILPMLKITLHKQINVKAIQYRLLVTSSLYRKCKYTARNRSAVTNDSVSNISPETAKEKLRKHKDKYKFHLLDLNLI
jgi:hypothetical protein